MDKNKSLVLLILSVLQFIIYIITMDTLIPYLILLLYALVNVVWELFKD